MVRTHNIVMNIRIFKLFYKAFIHEKIVNAPAYISIPDTKTIRPPRISIRFWVKPD